MKITKTGILLAGGEPGENILLYEPKSYTPTAYCAYQLNFSENLTAGETYTVQFWDIDVAHSAKTEDNLGIDLYWGGGSLRLCYWHGTNYFTDGHADYLTATFTITSAQASGSGATNLWFNVYNSVGYVAGTLSMSIGRWKLEKGSVATPWIPNPFDTLFTASNQGFIEDNQNMARIHKYGGMTATEFYEI